MIEDIGPDGVFDVVGEAPEYTTALLHEDTHLINTDDNREIYIKQRNIEIDTKSEHKIIDQKEAGELDYIIIKCGQDETLAAGTAAAAPSNLAVFLQLDGFAPGGLESEYDGTLGMSVKGVRATELSDLSLGNGGYGMLSLTKDTAAEIVVVFQPTTPRKYNHRIRLILTNLSTTTKLKINRIEIARRRTRASEGNSVSTARRGDQFGF